MVAPEEHAMLALFAIGIVVGAISGMVGVGAFAGAVLAGAHRGI